MGGVDGVQAVLAMAGELKGDRGRGLEESSSSFCSSPSLRSTCTMHNTGMESTHANAQQFVPFSGTHIMSPGFARVYSMCHHRNMHLATSNTPTAQATDAAVLLRFEHTASENLHRSIE